MKAITLHQPWASLIAQGLKHYETRSWGTLYRGKIAIHAGKVNHCKSPFQTISLFGEEGLSPQEYQSVEPVILEGYNLPTGCIIAIADMTDCILMTEKVICSMSQLEQKVGNWYPDRYAFKLENIKVVDPIPCKGAQGLWNYNQ